MSCIVVPIYKEFTDLNEQEIISISQLYKILYKHPIYLAGPTNLDWNLYIIDARLKGVNLIIQNFDDFYFESIAGYNKLLTSIKFYRSFNIYQYLLIYQLDAFVFRDELDDWCNKSYDYIGAPWFDGWHSATENSKIIGIGNGGFSLRNIKTSLTILKRLKILEIIRTIWNNIFFLQLIKLEKFVTFFNFILKIKNVGNFHFIDLDKNENEDLFWTQNVTSFFSDFNIATIDDAYKFSFETNPSFLFKLNSNRLPFGCHAWERYEPEFWKPIILKLK